DWTGTAHDILLREAASEAPDRVAIVDERTRWTYAELDARVGACAAGLAAYGLRAGDRCVVQLPNIAEFVQIVFALWRIGALPVMSLTSHRRSEIEYVCRLTEASAYVTCGRHHGFDHAALADQLRSDLGLGLVVVADTDVPDKTRSLATIVSEGRGRA